MLEIKSEPNITQIDQEKIVLERQKLAEWIGVNGNEEKGIKEYIKWSLKNLRKHQDKDEQLKTFGFWGNSEEIFFIDESNDGYRVDLTEELYQAILRAIKTASPANRERANRATLKGYGMFPAKNWSSPSQILEAAQYAKIDVRVVIKLLAEANNGGLHTGTGSSDDGYIYILKHANHAIVKIGKTKAAATERAINYANNHDDPDGWSVYHQVPSKKVSAVEARIHSSLESSRAAYGYNAKEVFAISVTFAMKVVYREIEL